MMDLWVNFITRFCLLDGFLMGSRDVEMAKKAVEFLKGFKR